MDNETGVGSSVFAHPLRIDEVTPEAVMERLSYRLSRIVGTGRQWSYHGVSSRTLIDVRTLKAYVQGTACPNLVKYKRLLAVLGPEIGTELNIMKGWLPRSDAVPPEAVDLVDLFHELKRARNIIHSVLGIPETRGEVAHAGTSNEKLADIMDAADLDDIVTDDIVDTLPEFRQVIKVEEISTAAVASRLSYRLRRMVGPGRRWEIGEVAEATAIDRRTLQSYLDGIACPNLSRYLRLGYFLGPEIGVEMARMIGWEPRFAPVVGLSRQELQQLAESLAHAQNAVRDTVCADSIENSAPRLIRRGDRID